MRLARGTSAGLTEEANLGDRREAIRVRHRTTFVIRQILSDGVAAPATVVLVYLSDTGVGIIHSIPLRCGDQFQIPLTRGAATAESMSLVCTVMRCEMLDDGLYNIGMKFNSPARAVDEGRRQLTAKR